MAPPLATHLLGAVITTLLSLTAIFVSWEHIQIKVTDVSGATVAQSWGRFGLFSSRECGPQPVAGVSWTLTSCHHYYTPTTGFTTDAGFRATATALASATLACAVLAGAVNLWGAVVLFEAVVVQGVSPRRRAAAASSVAWVQGASLLLALLGLAIFGRRLYADRAHFSNSDVRGDAGYALTVTLFFVNLALLLRHGVSAALEARKRRRAEAEAAPAAAAAAVAPPGPAEGGDADGTDNARAASEGGSPLRHSASGAPEGRHEPLPAQSPPIQPRPPTAAPPGRAAGLSPPAAPPY